MITKHGVVTIAASPDGSSAHIDIREFVFDGVNHDQAREAAARWAIERLQAALRGEP